MLLPLALAASTLAALFIFGACQRSGAADDASEAYGDIAALPKGVLRGGKVHRQNNRMGGDAL